MLTNAEIVSALRRSDQALCEQLAVGTPLEFGTAYCAPRFAALAEANQLRDVWLAELDAAAVWERTEAFFAEQEAVCRRWVPAAGQDVEPVAAFMAARGWRRVERTVHGLTDWSLAEATPDVGLRILPARAMKKALRQTFMDGSADAEARAAACAERLNDSNYDAFVAIEESRCEKGFSHQQPVGRAAYFEVGDIARLTDVFVMPAHRRRGVGRALAAHFVQMARRLLPRAIVAAAPAEDAGATAFLRRCGFSACGMVVHFDRP